MAKNGSRKNQLGLMLLRMKTNIDFEDPTATDRSSVFRMYATWINNKRIG